MIETTAIVENNRELAPGYRLLTLTFDEEIRARAGQFAMLKARPAFEPLLRRALAIYRVDGPKKLSFLYQVLGRGTEAISEIGPGGRVETLIALGNSWPVDSSRRAIIVAGGIGSASVMMLSEELARARVETQVFFGAATRGAAFGCGLEDFRALRLPLTVTTDDGSLGERGFVTEPLARYLREAGGAGATIYACGPWVMMRRVAEIAAESNTACQVSLEAPMGCGFGVCVGCVVAVKTDGPISYDSYKRVCIDGPIFPAEMVRWEVNAMTH
ncbi:MAG TPA: dihydroorotate dehydrogenase electron transfer subunit [Blastocatellia bacterium]|nr:dihydroorotate dehydrogenase electron transfer subunit [Blastocatellia bacterium]